MINFELSAVAGHSETFGRHIAKIAHRDALLIEYPDLIKYMNMLDDNTQLLREVIVIELRRQGKPWSFIAGLLGVSRQAAWERYSSIGDDLPELEELPGSAL
jgi:hypothetical protein